MGSSCESGLNHIYSLWSERTALGVGIDCLGCERSVGGVTEAAGARRSCCCLRTPGSCVMRVAAREEDAGA